MISSKDKLLSWSNKLLDMGRRNKLLNFKETRSSSLNFTAPTAEEIFKQIIGSVKMEVIFRGDKTQDAVIDETADEKIKKSIKRGQLLSSKNDYETKKALYRLRNLARGAIEEQGVNILYTAFCFLEWKDVNGDIYKSPILLVPSKITIDSINAPYKISEFEDEIYLNQTLWYKMKNSFNVILPEYDEDKHTGLSNYLEEVKAITDEKGWTITQEVIMAFFSFNKLNMYMDLVNNQEKVINNPIIRSICGETGQLDGFDTADFVSELDSKLSAENTYCVADADSSQLDAVLQLRKGKSFVLQGPPGTGKSQTITNLIAECLSEKKKVLFVSEKQAALNVVFRNLDRAGLEDFCLELHSAKANKKEVIAELYQTLTTEKSKVVSHVYDELSTLEGNIADLNEYVKALHKEIKILGKTPFEVFAEYESRKEIEDLDFSISDIKNKGSEKLLNIRKTLSSYISFNNVVGYDYRKNPHYGYVNPERTFDKEKSIKKLYLDLINALDDYEKASEKVTSVLGLTVDNGLKDSEGLLNLLEVLIKLKKIKREWLDKKALSETEEALKKLKEELKFYRVKTEELRKHFDLEILNYDFSEINTRFRSEYNGFFKIFNKQYKKDCNLIKSYLTVKKKMCHEELQLNVYKIKKIQEINKYLTLNGGTLSLLLGDYYRGLDTDYEIVEKQFDLLSEISVAMKGNLPEQLVKLISSEDVSSNSDLIKIVMSLKKKYDTLKALSDEVMKNFDKNQYDIYNDSYESIKDKFSRAVDEIAKLTDWVNFSDVLKEINKYDLEDFIEKAISSDIEPEETEGVYLRKFYYLWIDQILRQDEILGRFSREKHESIIESFRKKDKLAFKIAQARIREMLSKDRPGYNAASGNSEIGILLREAEKKRKQLSVRKLFEQIPSLITTLKPCLLMSPMSVSQYINPDIIKFDVVIFDEASQIFPEDALGAIYRGKQLIVVGDSEQLPPTNFFNVTTETGDFDSEDQEEDDDTSSFESILDICNSCLNRIRLKWHYRSKYEELIAFSNKYIYRDDLVSFPSATKKAADTGVEYIYLPDGVYDRSTSRTNKTEAQKVAEMVFEHFDKYPDRTLGVVAFSEAQQEAIENQIIKERRNRLDYEEFFDESKDEPFFIKNIESVQGDERDTIIFSIAYAKDSNGKIYMNFGPLSRDGGERRLNVAITRARINVKLVGSIEPTDINTEKCKTGVKLLRNYIEFARDGIVTLERDNKKKTERDMRFENSVLEVLKKHGYEADTEIGCSGYKIDLAVKHPDFPDVYVLGVECDGISYKNNRTARDRDRLRHDVLTRLNWNLYRIWSPDWIKRRETEEERLIAAVNSAISLVNSGEQTAIAKVDHKISFETVSDEEDNKGFEEYREVKAEDYYDKSKTVKENFKILMDAIMVNESPVHIDIVLKKVMKLFGRDKMSPYVKEQFKGHYAQWKPSNVIYKDHYFILIDKPIKMRVPKEGNQGRSIENIHIFEIYDGIKRVIKRDVGITKEGLIKEISSLLNYSRVTETISDIIGSAAEDLISKKILKKEGEMIRIV